MYPKLRPVLILFLTMALTLPSVVASAKKKKKKKADDDTTEQVQTPDKAQPAPAAEATPAPGPAKDSPPPAASVSVSVSAPEQPAPAPAPVQVAAPPPSPPPPPPPPPFEQPVYPRDGVRFRGGVAIVGGGEFVSGFAAGLLGIDGRLGVQINRFVGIYLQPHFSAGTGVEQGGSGPTGTVSITAMADVTLLNRIFIGAGAGFGLVENPYGAVVAFRFGGYPVMRFSRFMPRRKGLMLGIDMRTYVLTSTTPTLPVIQMMGAIGYEAF
jgi:hypothetical protein